MARKVPQGKFRPNPEHFDHWNQTIAQSTGDFYAGRTVVTGDVFVEDDKPETVVQLAPKS